MSAGDFTHSHTDLSIPAVGIPLEFTRYYHSRSTNNRTLGYGWTHSYDMYLEIDGQDATVFYPQGHAVFFDYNGNEYVPRAGVTDTLVQDAGNFALTTQEQMVYTFSGTDGSLSSITDRNGNPTTLTYTGGLLATVTDPWNRSLSFRYSSGRLVKVTDPILREVEFAYEADGDLDTVEDVKDGITSYDYGDYGLESLTDANGNPAVNNLYDSAGRDGRRGRNHVHVLRHAAIQPIGQLSHPVPCQ